MCFHLAKCLLALGSPPLQWLAVLEVLCCSLTPMATNTVQGEQKCFLQELPAPCSMFLTLAPGAGVPAAWASAASCVLELCPAQC